MSLKPTDNMVAILDFQRFHLIEKFHNFSLYVKDSIKLPIHQEQVLLDFSLYSFELIQNIVITALQRDLYAGFFTFSNSGYGFITFFVKLG